MRIKAHTDFDLVGVVLHLGEWENTFRNPPRMEHRFTDRVTLHLKAGDVVDKIVPGHWCFEKVKGWNKPHKFVERGERDGAFTIITMDLEDDDLPLKIPGFCTID